MNKNHFWYGLVAIIVIAILGWWAYYMLTPGKYDTFAQCLKEKGAIFYGAFWCPHCAEQKAMFGKSKKNLPYVECSTPDGRGQLPVCDEKGIKGYPTWFFGDSEPVSAVLTFPQLGERTGCEIPE